MMPVFNFILFASKPFKWLIAGFFLTGFFWAMDLSLRPYILRNIINQIVGLHGGANFDPLWGSIILYSAISLLLVLVFRFQDYFWLRLNPLLKCHIGDLLIKRMMDQSLSLFQNHFAGNLANKIKDVMSGVPDLLNLLIIKCFSHFLALLIAIFTVSIIHYKFSLLMVAWLTVFITGSVFFTNRAKKLFGTAAEIRSKVVGQMVDILSNIVTVQLFTGKKTESKTLKTYFDQYIAADQKRDWWFLFLFGFQGLSFVIYQILGFLLLMFGMKEGIITAGDFALLIGINISIIDSLWSLSKDMFSFSEILGNLRQGLRIVLEPVEIQDQPNATILKVNRGQIIFDKVQFHYKGIDPLFNDKSVTIEGGQKVGLVGYSGGGKSTFVNLILRLYDITQGSILIDGQNIKEVTQDSLRQGISMIPQDPSLFHRSLMDNIRYGRIDATDEEVMDASKKAQIHEFIAQLPEGYETLVGERGVKLSGGQRQRIAIARAILKDAPILILDEATSQLDSLTEIDIQENLKRFMEGKTTIIIAHRLSTLLNMDRILVFEKGKILEDGTHEELLIKDGLYTTLWNAQIGGFLQDQKNGETK